MVSSVQPPVATELADIMHRLIFPSYKILRPMPGVVPNMGENNPGYKHSSDVNSVENIKRLLKPKNDSRSLLERTVNTRI